MNTKNKQLLEDAYQQSIKDILDKLEVDEKTPVTEDEMAKFINDVENKEFLMLSKKMWENREELNINKLSKKLNINNETILGLKPDESGFEERIEKLFDKMHLVNVYIKTPSTDKFFNKDNVSITADQQRSFLLSSARNLLGVKRICRLFGLDFNEAGIVKLSRYENCIEPMPDSIYFKLRKHLHVLIKPEVEIAMLNRDIGMRNSEIKKEMLSQKDEIIKRFEDHIAGKPVIYKDKDNDEYEHYLDKDINNFEPK